MITDTIDQIKRYAVPKLEAILKFIHEHDCAQLQDGEMEIEGRQLFVRIMSYVPKPALENRFETHRNYADVQYLVSGTEIMQTARKKDLISVSEYDPKGDYQFFKASGAVSDFVIQAGEFGVFFPQEAHRPSCAYPGHMSPVKKLVFKVKINETTR
jgi:biofilm protein TabA